MDWKKKKDRVLTEKELEEIVMNNESDLSDESSCLSESTKEVKLRSSQLAFIHQQKTFSVILLMHRPFWYQFR